MPRSYTMLRNLCSKVDLGLIHGVPQNGKITLPKNVGGSIKNSVVMPIKIADIYIPDRPDRPDRANNMKEPANVKNLYVLRHWWNSNFR